MTQPDPMADVLAALLAASTPGDVLSLDTVGDAIGTRAVDTERIDRLIADLEAAGRRVQEPSGPGAAADLRSVLTAVRTLHARLGRRPSVDEIASHAGLAPGAVRAALALGRVMGR